MKLRMQWIFSILALLAIIVFGIGGFQSETIQAKDLLGAEEREVTFDSAGFTLYGTLSVPEHRVGEKLPVIVLVHGSGPNDRDETIPVGVGMSMKPFLKLARGFQQEGFVVLRYDKRSYTVSKENLKLEKPLSVDDFILDARAAIDYVRRLPEVDPDQVILLGHSQGAGFVPQIAEGKHLAAAVAVAPSMLPIMETVVYQLEYQKEYLTKLNKNGTLDQQIKLVDQYYLQYKESFEQLKNGTFPLGKQVVGTPADFWLHWQERSMDTPEKFIQMESPVLIVNGTEDLKVPVNLLKEKESFLQQKEDLEILYLPGVGHELYYSQTLSFATQLPGQIADWWQGLN